MITGDQLKVINCWNSSIHFCQWHGVTCGRNDRRVIKLELQFLKLSGSLSPFIGNLSFLKELNLVSNNFHSQIPQEIGRLRRLETLQLSNNSMTGEIPSNLSSCSKLTFVSMRGNQLTGEIPASLGLLSNMKTLGFAINRLRGSIPPSFGNLSSLEALILRTNALSGVIPEDIGRLKNLSFFSVEENTISGIIRGGMFNLSNIRSFDIGGNNIQGALPSDLAITMPYVDFFSVLRVSQNQLSGPIPLNMGRIQKLNTFDSLIMLELQFLKLSGSLSPFIGNLSFLKELNLASNNFHNQIPQEIGRLRRLETLQLSNNSITGEIPSNLSSCSKLTFVSMRGNQLTGEIPASLGLLSNMKTLSFAINRLRGSIPPSFGNLSSSEALILRTNALSGVIPEDIGRLTNLSFFSVEENAISGIIPVGMFNLSNIRSFDIGGNNIEEIENNKILGRIPDGIGNLINLGVLQVSQNQLSGPIPLKIGRIQKLNTFDARNNFLTGTIPYSIGNLTGRLEILDLINNSISGEIPSNLSACSKLTFFRMRSNQLTGEIPGSFGLLSKLKFLSFINNSLTGSIPPALGNLSSLEELYFTYNALSGVLPEGLGRLTNLTQFSADENAISGIIPTAIRKHQRVTKLELQLLKVSGSLSPYIGNLSFLRELNLAGNSFYNQIPQEIGRLRRLEILDLINNSIRGEIPSNLSACSKLTFVRMRSNQLTGEIPVIQQNKIWGRIPEGIANLINLETLGASRNQLSGPIPSDIGRLQNLKIFYASNNSLSGYIPHSIGNLTVLSKLALDFNNLQGTIPSSLSHNNLSGPIHPQVLGLPSLSITLDLSSNYLTGELPVAVENLKSLGEFHVSKNKLSGLLPSSLGSCVSLEKLFLDGNLFEGPIPSSLSSLRGLEALDVSNNNLSGEIPEFLVRFGALRYLNLSFNNFEGVIPSGGIFKNASATFVEGNSKLCGGIPELHMLRCNLKTSSSNSQRLKVAIIVVTLGVTLAFTCLLILWFRKKKEKQATTTSVENSFLQLSYQSILRATDGFSTQNLVGSGSFGSVYKGVLEASGAVIAVKVLNLLNRGASRSFLAECEALKNIRHRNLVKVLTAISGVDDQGNDFKALVYEFMENGSLEDWLHPVIGMNEPETARNLNFFQRVSMAIDVAHALEYLHHHCEEPIIHCDLKPSNILLDEEMVGHISDFGLAKILSTDRLNYSANKSSSLGLRGTIGYAAPGVLEASGAVIAVKVLNLLNRGASRSFLAECEALKNIRHRNLVKVLTAISGVDYQGNNFKALVYEFMENGSLEDWLRPLIGMNEPETARNLNFFQSVNVAIDVAHALEYLHHHCEEPIIHCDLKPSNILLDKEMVGHISDFGLAKILSTDRLNYSANKSSSLGLRGTIEYGMGSELSTKGDVYSYGILLLEMFTGKKPTDERFREGLSLRNFVKAALPERIIAVTDPILVEERVTRGTSDVKNSRNDRHLRCLNSLFEIGLTCSAESPNERIDMSDVVIKLCSIRDKFHPTRLRHEVRT
ncbi:hypothetical protein V6Z11_A10G279900 [Gossypium hirsutum]